MAVLGIDDFKAALKGGGARPNLYRVEVGSPLGITIPEIEGAENRKNMSFMCSAAQLPASIMGTVPVPFRGRAVQVAGDRVFEPWVVTVYNDTDFKIRQGMERWMNAINAHQANVGATNPLAYKADLIVDQLDKSGKQLYRYEFRGTFPTNVSAIDLSYGDNDRLEEFTIEFQVDYWESYQGTGTTSSGNSGVAVAGPAGEFGDISALANNI